MSVPTPIRLRRRSAKELLETAHADIDDMMTTADIVGEGPSADKLLRLLLIVRGAIREIEAGNVAPPEEEP